MTNKFRFGILFSFVLLFLIFVLPNRASADCVSDCDTQFNTCISDCRSSGNSADVCDTNCSPPRNTCVAACNQPPPGGGGGGGHGSSAQCTSEQQKTFRFTGSVFGNQCPSDTACIVTGIGPFVSCYAEGGTNAISHGICPANSQDPQCAPAQTSGVPCDGGVQTALGCLHTGFSDFVTDLLRFGTAAGGGVALLLMAIAALRMMLSGGNPETVKKAREQFVAAAIGLTFIILSVTIMQIIGIEILQIPGIQ